jgi:Fe-S cluster assembly iron-binding protein IscA
MVPVAINTQRTLPAVNIGWQDGDSGTNVNMTFTATNASNAVGANQQGSVVVYAKSAVALQYTTLGYMSSGTTSMQYSLHLKIERL